MKTFLAFPFTFTKCNFNLNVSHFLQRPAAINSKEKQRYYVITSERHIIQDEIKKELETIPNISRKGYFFIPNALRSIEEKS